MRDEVVRAAKVRVLPVDDRQRQPGPRCLGTLNKQRIGHPEPKPVDIDEGAFVAMPTTNTRTSAMLAMCC